MSILITARNSVSRAGSRVARAGSGLRAAVTEVSPGDRFGAAMVAAVGTALLVTACASGSSGTGSSATGAPATGSGSSSGAASTGTEITTATASGTTFLTDGSGH